VEWIIMKKKIIMMMRLLVMVVGMTECLVRRGVVHRTDTVGSDEY
jgi:hypothetical protein